MQPVKTAQLNTRADSAGSGAVRTVKWVQRSIPAFLSGQFALFKNSLVL